jgi:hypothetical protein
VESASCSPEAILRAVAQAHSAACMQRRRRTRQRIAERMRAGLGAGHGPPSVMAPYGK